MGNHISLKPSNKTMVDRLVERHCYISSQKVEGVFRAVDRAMYYDIEEGEPTDPYEDDPWRRGNLHLSAPCIYAKVVEALDLRHGLSFLNLGSGTGYLNTIVGLLIGPNGINHGIEFYADVVDYAYDRLHKFKQKSHAIDKYDFAEPIFMKGNCLNLNTKLEYDRIYLGAACLPSMEMFVKKLIKPGGGILVMPFENHLIRHTRISANEWKSEKLMDVNFTLMIGRNEDDTDMIDMPLPQVKSLRELCRIAIRQQLRTKTDSIYPNLLHSDNIEYRRQRAKAHHAALHCKDKLDRLRRTNLRRRTDRESEDDIDDDGSRGRYSCCCNRGINQNKMQSSERVGTSALSDRIVTRSASRCPQAPSESQRRSARVQSSRATVEKDNEPGECSMSGHSADASRTQAQSFVDNPDSSSSSETDDDADKLDCARTRPLGSRGGTSAWPSKRASDQPDSDSLSSSSSLHSTDNSVYDDLTDELDDAYESEHWCAFPLSNYSNPHSPPLFWNHPETDSSSSLSDDQDDGRIYAIRFPEDFRAGVEDGEEDEDDAEESDLDEQLSGSDSEMSLVSSPSELVGEALSDTEHRGRDGTVHSAASNDNKCASREQPVASRLRSRRSLQPNDLGGESGLLENQGHCSSHDGAHCKEYQNRLSNSSGRQFSRVPERRCCEPCRSSCHRRLRRHGCCRCLARSESNRRGTLDYSPASVIISNSSSSISSQADQIFSNRLLIATGLGTTSFSISTRPANDRLLSPSSGPPVPSSSSPRVTFQPLTLRSAPSQSDSDNRCSRPQSITPIGHQLTKIAGIQSQSLQNPTTLSVHKRKRPLSSSSDLSDAPSTSAHASRQCGRSACSRMRTRSSHCICKRCHCSINSPPTRNSSNNPSNSANNVSNANPMHGHESGRRNCSHNDNGQLLNQPRQGSSFSCSSSPNINNADQLKRLRERVNSGNSGSKLQQSNTSTMMAFRDEDGEHFRQNESRQECSLDQNNDIIRATTRTTRSSIARCSASAVSSALPSASTAAVKRPDDRGVAGAHKKSPLTGNEKSTTTTTRALAEQSTTRSTDMRASSPAPNPQHCSGAGRCRSCFIKKSSGRFSGDYNCKHQHCAVHGRRHQHNHKCRHSHRHHHRHHCRHRHEHHRCHHQRQQQQQHQRQQPKQLPSSSHRGIYLYRNHRQSQQQRASKRLGDLVKSGSAWRRIEALRSRVEAARAGALQERRRRLKRERRSKRKRQNECEKYHNHMCSYIRRLPLPKVLQNYLNYDRSL